MKVTGSSIQQLDKGPDGRKPKSRCRKWRLWASTEQGRKSRRFDGTYTQAQDALCAFVAELEGLVPNSETFAAYAESWRLWRAESGIVRDGTAKSDKTNVNALAASPLGPMRMDAITPEACREALLWVKAHPARGDGELSAATMRNRHAALLSIMSQALADGRIASNPMASVARPRSDTGERRALTSDEMDALLEAVDLMPLDGRTMALRFICMLGLRRAEACALLDADVGDVAVVRGSVVECTSEMGPTKSDAGVRKLPVPAPLAEKVDAWRMVRAGRGWSSSETLCCNAVGNMLHPSALYRWWGSVRGRLGCDGVTLHDLRHSNLTKMARVMSPFDLQRYAGWGSLAPALTYVHDDMDAVSRAVHGAWEVIECTKSAPESGAGQSA